MILRTWIPTITWLEEISTKMIPRNTETATVADFSFQNPMNFINEFIFSINLLLEISIKLKQKSETDVFIAIDLLIHQIHQR